MTSFIEHLPIGAVHVIGGSLTMNAVAESLIGHSRERITTLTAWFEVLYGDDAVTVQEKYEKRRLDGFSGSTRRTIKRADGERRLLEFRSCVNVIGEIWILDDITERVAADAQLVEAKRLAEASSRAKSQFLANMSHEIRTPLNGVLAMAQMMTLGELQSANRHKVDVILQSGKELLHIINDILDFTKIEAGKLELESIAFDPEAVLESALACFAAAAARKNLTMHLDVAAGARGLRLGDPARFRQIVNNFVSNATKFTAEGRVRISLHDGGPEGGEGLTLAVADTGPGIAPEKVPLLFQKFSQVDASNTRQYRGTGLGLAISRELAVLMGGSVGVESELGSGSTFSATLGMARVEHERRGIVKTDHLPPSVRPERVRVLAAEDNRTNQLVLKTIMNVFGFELTLVDNGFDVVEAWSAGTYDVILMDVQMPKMDGVAAARAIRKAERERGWARTPILALTANAFVHQVEQYLEAGMDAHVPKPIEVPRLREALDRWIALGAQWRSEPLSSAAAAA